MGDYRAMALLTEHFGFPPIALIDEVINAVNIIMYKCPQAMESYLNERQQRRAQEGKEELGRSGSSKEQKGVPRDEIAVGTAKLETLLESQVDKNFDKLELYALRNIFTIPENLIEQGWFRLKHHEGMDFETRTKTHEHPNSVDKDIEKLVESINAELGLRKLLKLQIVKAKRLVDMLQKFKRCLEFVNSDSGVLSPEAKTALKALSPMDENLYFLLKQVDTLISQVQQLHHKFAHNSSEGGIKDIKFLPTIRDTYIQGKSYRLLESIGVLEPDNLQTSNENHDLTVSNFTTSQHIEAAREINEKLKILDQLKPQQNQQPDPNDSNELNDLLPPTNPSNPCNPTQFSGPDP